MPSNFAIKIIQTLKYDALNPQPSTLNLNPKLM